MGLFQMLWSLPVNISAEGSMIEEAGYACGLEF